MIGHAQFVAGDPDELVAASLTCCYCLHIADVVQIREVAFGAIARCHCLACAAATDVRLDEGQLLRIALQPPETIQVRVDRNP